MKTEIDRFLKTLHRSPRTIFAYRNALEQFVKVVGEDANLSTETYIKFLTSLEQKSPSTQRIYTTAVLQFYTYCEAGNWAELREATKHYTHKSGKRVVKFNREAIEKVISYCESLNGGLLALRDRAFVLTLVDTGLRISEACSLKCGDIDWSEKRAIVIGQGNRQASVRYSDRSVQALKDYLRARERVEPNSPVPVVSQPLFARHDIRASKKIRAVGAGGMWKAIKDRITEAGVDRSLVKILDFRHYFVTMIYLAIRDLKLSQELARHESISSTTNRYVHFGNEADKAYDAVFNKKPK